MDDLVTQIDIFRRHMTDDAYRRLGELQKLDGVLADTDGQLLEYLNGVFRRHNERQSQMIMRLVEEAKRYQLPHYPPEHDQVLPGATQDGDLRAPRVLGGGSMQAPLSDENEGFGDTPENWKDHRGPYQGWQQ